MAPDDEDSSSAGRKPDATLDPSGRLERAAPRKAPPEVRPLHEAPPLELQERAPRQAEEVDLERRYREAVVPRRRAPFWGILAMLILAGAGGALLWFPDLPGRLRAAGTPRPPAYLYVSSEPDGATIKVGETVIGQTPFAGENVYTGAVPIELSLAGYRTWRGTFTGGEEARVEVRLRR